MRASNPTGAAPGASPKKKTEASDSAAGGAGATKSQYQQDTERDNPEPVAGQSANGSVVLTECRFLTPESELVLNEEFEMSVLVKATADVKNRRANFDLFCTRVRDGREESTRIWAQEEGSIVDAAADPVQVKAKAVLATSSDYVPGESVKFHLEASHPQASEVAKSPEVEISLRTQATYYGGEDLWFRTDGELPYLKDDGSLIHVLAAVLDRVAHPPQKDQESVVCFGFASSSAGDDHNRKLSRRRALTVKAILDRDTGSWDGLAKANFETVDLQQFLSGLHVAFDWKTDPGAPDGKAGPKTQAAVESFQRECNTRWNLALKEDGICGPKTWRAVLRAIHGLVQDELGQDSSKEPSWPKPRWGHGGQGVYANGEDYASGGNKQADRKVEVAFYSPGSEPVLVDKIDASVTISDNPNLDDRKVVWKKGDARPRGGKPKAVAPPAAQEPKPDLFAEFRRLEKLADSDKYDLSRKITAFRKIYYDKGYMNTLIWDQLIAGAKDVTYPASWGDMVAQQRDMGRRKVMALNGEPVDISHVFVGADARNHPAAVELLLCNLRSNVEASTWVGDLGSVVVEYIHNTSAKEFAGTRTADLENFFDRDSKRSQFDLGDQVSDIDGVLIDFAAAGSVVAGLEAYYADNGPWKQRWRRFLPIFERAKSGLRDAVFNAAVAYAMAHYKADLNQLFASVQQPDPNNPFSTIDLSNVSIHMDLPIIGRIDIYTLREQYWNNCQWVIDIFEERIHAHLRG